MENPALKIEILLHEYDTLRVEVLSRYSAQFQAIGAFSVLFAGLLAALAAGLSPEAGWPLIIGGLVIFVLLFLWADADISRLATRLVGLEKDINSRAGETLLVWETNHPLGGGLERVLGRIFKKETN